MKIGELINCYNHVNKISIRDIAKDIGISRGALDKIRNGKDYDMEALLRVLIWMVSPTPTNNKD